MSSDYYESKAFKQALAKYEEAVAQGATVYLDCDQLSDIAEYYQWTGDTSKALSTADYTLSLFEGATIPLALKARIALLNENNPEKAEQLTELIADKKDLDYFYIRAEILVATNRGEEADLFLESNMEGLDDLDRLDLVLDAAILFIDYEYVDLAKKWLEKSDETDEADYREVEGRIKFYEGDYKACECIFNQLIDKNPYNSYYWVVLASAQLAQNHLSDAITSSEYAIAINPKEEDALLYKGQALVRLKNYEEALEYFEKVSQVRSSNVEGYLNSANCLFILNRYDEGLVALRKAETRAKRHYPDRLSEIYQEEALAYSHLGEKERALACLETMEQQVETDPYELMVTRAHIYCENDDLPQAQLLYKQAVVESRYQPSVMLRVAVSLYDNNFLQVAYNILCALDPADQEKLPQAHAYMAACAHDLGLDEAFIAHLGKAVELSPSASLTVLSPLFPEGMEPQEYVKYATDNLLMK
ncbi:MAG: tetratricopeptide repeat protein [Prevotella sp.]|nr:tetratricopeptide repeat protein [Prevotella sp.]MBR7054778.1 tetratricopeptide repeat protein [Prevotella sp.]